MTAEKGLGENRGWEGGKNPRIYLCLNMPLVANEKELFLKIPYVILFFLNSRFIYYFLKKNPQSHIVFN